MKIDCVSDDNAATSGLKKAAKVFELDDIGHGPTNCYAPFRIEHYQAGVYQMDPNRPFSQLERARLVWDIVCKHRVCFVRLRGNKRLLKLCSIFNKLCMSSERMVVSSSHRELHSFHFLNCNTYT